MSTLQKLQMSLDHSKANIKEEGYGLNWVGKKEDIILRTLWK